MSSPKQPKLYQALIPILALVGFLALNVYLFGDDTLGGANQTALILAGAIAAVISIRLGRKWTDIRSSIVKSISSAMPSILILLLIGALAGTWMISGVVPAMVFYGLKMLNPTIFLFASVIVSALVSLATGSSWSTIATIGIALLGIGNTLGISEGITAGAVISGAYFGDKMSPLSDTTNLAPAMAGTDLFTHIRYMTYTTVPTISITLVIFLVMGFVMDFGTAQTDIQGVLTAIEGTFYITPWLFLVPVFLITIIIKKVPPLPALLAGSLAGAVFAVIFQPDVVITIAGEGVTNIQAFYKGTMQAMFGDVTLITENASVNDLLSTSGMAGMLNTIWLILAAMMFGGIMEAAGMLKRITDSIIRFANSTGSLVFSTAITSLIFNLTASDQYIAIVVPGRMYADTYRKRGLKPEVLSRTLEDSGTVTSVLIPWNTCGATQSSVLGVSVVSYLPYAFFSIISPIMTVLFAYLNIKIRRFTDKEMAEIKLEDNTANEKE